MESLESLKNRKKQAEYELERITIKKHNSTPWAAGVQDQHKSDSFSYNEYTDVSKAYRLQAEIRELEYKIDNYARTAQANRQAQEVLQDLRTPKYGYTAGGKSETTTNKAIAARYDAQHRFHGMSKLQQTIAKLNGQYKKFQILWNKANISTSRQEQEEVANELDRMFRR